MFLDIYILQGSVAT